jgi:hypothetical protein
MGLDRRNGLSPVSQYKAFEKKLASRVKKGFKSFFSKVGGFFQNLYQFGKQQFTIMLIPHSEKSIINLKVNMFFLMVLGVLAMTGVGILLYQTFIDIDSSQSRLVLEHQTEIQQSKLELFQNDINDLEPTLRQFEKVFTETLDVIGIESDLSGEVSNDRRGDLQDLFSYAEAEADTPREIGQIRAIKTLLEESIDPLIDISRVIEAQKNLIVDIPTLWPLKNGQGWPTFYFGPAIHPFTGQWYMHRVLTLLPAVGLPWSPQLMVRLFLPSTTAHTVTSLRYSTNMVSRLATPIWTGCTSQKGLTSPKVTPSVVWGIPGSVPVLTSIMRSTSVPSWWIPPNT